MNETPEPAAPALAQAAAAPSAGSLLRQAREAAGQHIGALAVAIHVPLKKLEALEADRYDLLPETVYTRALASKVCRALKIDPEPVLRLLPQHGAPHLRPDGAGMNVPFQRPGDDEHGGVLGQLPKPALAAVLALLAGAFALLFYPSEPTTPPARLTDSSAQPAAPMGVAPALVLADATPAPVPAPAPQPVRAPVPAPAAPPALVAAAAAPAAPKTVPAPPPVGADAASTRQLLQFKTKGTSWIEVLDAQGAVLLRRNLEPGESTGVSSGALPLTVVIGRADATEVWLRGKPFSLQNVSSENVARFEVK